MNCLTCKTKSCRKTVSCGAESFDIPEALRNYHAAENQQIIQVAAQLVDNKRAGTLSRIQELIEFAQSMHYKRIGLAYCYGMEALAAKVRDIFTKAGLSTIGVSCTVGAFSQSMVNEKSTLSGVSCSPLNQAEQLTAQNVDLAVVIGLCMGHDILFNQYFHGDVTTLVVKDRPFNHNPILGIEAYE